jgi:hypothetical protein
VCYIEDEHLFRVGFMSAGEAGALVDNMLSLGLHQEAVTVEQMTEPPPRLAGARRDRRPSSGLAGRTRPAAGEINIRYLEADETANDLGAARLEVTQGDALVDLCWSC